MRGFSADGISPQTGHCCSPVCKWLWPLPLVAFALGPLLWLQLMQCRCLCEVFGLQHKRTEMLLVVLWLWFWSASLMQLATCSSTSMHGSTSSVQFGVVAFVNRPVPLVLWFHVILDLLSRWFLLFSQLSKSTTEDHRSVFSFKHVQTYKTNKHIFSDFWNNHHFSSILVQVMGWRLSLVIFWSTVWWR